MSEEERQPELKDIIEMLYRYNAVNKNNVCVIVNIVGFKKDPEHKCVDCGDDCDCINDKASMMSAYGDLPTLRVMLNDLRDMVEEEVDEDGFVNY